MFDRVWVIIANAFIAGMVGCGKPEPGDGTYTCNAPDGEWTTIRNTPAAFVIGNCKNGSTVKLAKATEFLIDGFQWGGGRIWGNFNADGWIREDSLLAIDSFSDKYTSASTAPSDFGALFSCKYGTKIDGLCEDGNDFYLASACPAYANRGGHDKQADLPPGTHIRWRYRDLDDSYVMVRVDSRTCAHSGQGENHALGWVFVPADCIEYPPRRVSPNETFVPEKHCLHDRWSNNTGVCAANSSASTLLLGQPLARGDHIYSANHSAMLVHQPDGNLVLYRTSDMSPLWSTNTSGQATTHAVQQGEGMSRLVLKIL